MVKIMNRSNIDKIARTPEDKVLLAKVWDKIHGGMDRNIIANTCFLTLRELDMTRYLFGDMAGLVSFGGYSEAERQMLVYLPEYLDETAITGEDSPVVCIQANFYPGDNLTHRDILGALMGMGIARETIGDIYVGSGLCNFFVTAEIAPFILQNFSSAGRTKLHLASIPLSQVQIAEPETTQIKDTLASLRLDSVIATGFRIGRTLAAQHITAGKATVDGLPCEKPDKPVDAGSRISVRGLGKIKLTAVNGQTKKGRISVVIDRYV